MWRRYDLPLELIENVWKGRYRGQEQKWFAFRFLGDDTEIDLNAHPPPEFSVWRWIDLQALPALIVPFKRETYRAVVREFANLASVSETDSASGTDPASAWS